MDTMKIKDYNLEIDILVETSTGLIYFSETEKLTTFLDEDEIDEIAFGKEELDKTIFAYVSTFETIPCLGWIIEGEADHDYAVSKILIGNSKIRIELSMKSQ